MDKVLLHRVIGSGFIRGICDRAVLFFDGRNLCCEFISENKILTGRVVSVKFNDGNNFIGEHKIGLPSIDSFLKMLKTLGDDVTAEVEREGRDERYLILGDGTLQMKYGLITNSQMPKIPRISMEALSKNPVKLPVDKDFITKFHKLSGAIKDCKYLFVKTDGSNIDLILSQSEDYETGAKMTYPIDGGETIETLVFDTKTFRGVLYNNRHCGRGVIEFHSGGLAEINFFSENIKTNYHILAE
jgi:hypothetical protein